MPWHGKNMWEAASEGNIARIENRLNLGKNIDQPNIGDGNKTALMYAAEHGHPECVDFLIGRGADLNRETENGMTALMYATEANDIMSMKHLLENGAKLVSCTVREAIKHRYGYDKHNALIIAMKNNNTLAAKFLMENGAEFDMIDAFYGMLHKLCDAGEKFTTNEKKLIKQLLMCLQQGGYNGLDLCRSDDEMDEHMENLCQSADSVAIALSTSCGNCKDTIMDVAQETLKETEIEMIREKNAETMSLKNQARIAICKSLSQSKCSEVMTGLITGKDFTVLKSFQQKVSELDIPKTLRAYLQYDDLHAAMMSLVDRATIDEDLNFKVVCIADMMSSNDPFSYLDSDYDDDSDDDFDHMGLFIHGILGMEEDDTLSYAMYGMSLDQLALCGEYPLYDSDFDF
ncbi:unnamed protein product [Owenia fusiformis]|uniref:Uncharacterized protein n=1 Tax=Owenia fusiformis TaxID=6347 RepID=A0A8J1UQB5_OWEFU|nr:unnamed protein product [Owenia fusiformis]